MPVKRRLHKGTPHRITDDAIAAGLAGDQVELHRALDLRPWQTSPFDVDAGGDVREDPLINVPDDWPRGTETAARLRRELLKYGQPGKAGRHGRPWQPGDDEEDEGRACRPQ